MYSIVLMAAMTTGMEAPGFGSHYGSKFWGKHCFFESCFPARYGWTCAPGWGGYYPGGCYGCYGACHGCWSSCHGCWSSCHGCSGLGYNWHSCHGCTGVSCYGCYGSLNPGLAGVGYFGYGAYGNFGMYGAVPVPINAAPVDPLGLTVPGGYAPVGYPATTPPATTPGVPSGNLFGPGDSLNIPTPNNPAPATPAVPGTNKEGSPTNTDKLTSFSRENDPRVGSIEITVPANARVYIEGNLMKSDSTVRLFHSPPLEAGYSYSYTVTVEYAENGKRVEVERKVRIRAGETTKVRFGDATPLRDGSSIANAAK